MPPPPQVPPAPDLLAPAGAVSADAPSLKVAAIYLRPHNGVHHPGPDETLVDSITRIVTGMLEQHIRESVTAAVRALAPRLLISFPPQPSQGPAKPASIQGRLDDDLAE